MPEVKYLNPAFAFLDSVVSKNWAMHKFSHLRTFTNDPSHAREARKQIQMIEQRVPEARCGLSIVLGNMADDFGEIA